MENPEFIHASYFSTQLSPEKRLSDEKNGDHFAVEDLLDFPTDEYIVAADGGETGMTGISTGSSVMPVDTSYSGEPHFLTAAADVCGPRRFSDGHFPSEFCVPYDDVAELEWLSNFVDDSFAGDDLQKLQLIQGMKTRTNETAETYPTQYHFQPEITRPRSEEIPVSAKARSKRLRAATGNWNSPLLAVSRTPTPPPPAGPTMSSSSDSVVTTAGKKSIKQMTASKKNDSPPENSTGGGEGRRCLHCATDKTPQWRTGPLGPKTLCNACGVRYKSGRLVPEYRPASSPSFVMSKHSNSHRKVMELRRQKEMMKAQQPFMHHQNGMMFDGSNGEDYLIHQHIVPDFRQINI